MLIEGKDLSNLEYHSREEFSSSQLKDALEDVERFYKIHVAKTMAKPSMNQDALDIGSYYHAAILEPHLLDEEFAVFTGARRAGKEWTDFQNKHGTKTVLNLKGYGDAQVLVEATQNNKAAMELLKEGQAELSCITHLEKLPIRVRADFINSKKGYILDLKSMTGNAKDESKIVKAIRDRNYDMSAALYVDAFNSVLPKKEQIKEFYWVFASKDYANCRVWRMTPELYELGKNKYLKAIMEITEAKKRGWKFEEDQIFDVSPAKFELMNYGIENDGDTDLI